MAKTTKNTEVITSYKGFNKDMTCRGFKYEEGKTYKEDKAEACRTGFHACEYPLDVLNYYEPSCSVYRKVAQSGKLSRHDGDTKVASTEITIGEELSLADLVSEAIAYTTARVNPEASSDENYGASSATGYKGASSATGNCGASSATGAGSVAVTTGYNATAEANNPDSIAVAFGAESKAKGVKGAYIVLTERDDDNNLTSCRMIHIDGKRYKADTFYCIRDGKVVKTDE